MPNTSEAGASIAARIDALLPQTQCTRCGYPTCRAYADAIAGGSADIDRCPPGGADGIAALARLLGRDPKPLDPTVGVEAAPAVARIDEDTCIGCTKCIEACPVDAIVGAGKRMHAVVADECTGCELCVPPCPVDCIAIVPIARAPLARDAVMQRAAHARMRFDAREARRASPTPARGARASVRIDALAPSTPDPAVDAATTPDPTTAATGTRPIDRAAVLAAIARGRARRTSRE